MAARVLIVDDSALVRKILHQGLSKDPNIQVVGVATDPFDARDKMMKLKPDVLTLDVEMPRMDGIEFLKRLMAQRPTPVVMVSSLTQKGAQMAMDALAVGAVDIVPKPRSDLNWGLPRMIADLCEKVKIASRARVQVVRSVPKSSAPRMSKALAESTDKVIAIGASTGGTMAVRSVLQGLPTNTPGVVVVQHMPHGFTEPFAQGLHAACNLTVKEAKHRDKILSGNVLIAPAGKQMHVRRVGGFYEVEVRGEEKVSGHCPSVDVLMRSMAQHVGTNGVGAILTGMGDDGAKGLAEFRQSGGRTVAQNEASCVVFGMPKVAHEHGGVECLRPLDKIADTIMGYFG